MSDVLAWLDLETTDTNETLRHSAILEVGVVFTWFDLQPIYEDDSTECFVINPGLDRDKQSFIDEYDLPNRLTEEETLQGIWNRMDPVVQNMHALNGLWDDVCGSRLSTEAADEVLASTLSEVQRHCGPIHIAGSGVGHFDMRYLRRHFPRSFSHFEFAPYDVGSVRRIMRDLAGIDTTSVADPQQKSSGEAKAHRALDDAWAHLHETRAYVQAFQGMSFA